MKKGIGILLLFWLAATAVIAQAHHVSPNRDYNNPGPLPANVTHITINSRYLNPDNNEVGLAVYTPPGYDETDNTRRYPVIYMLHGIQGHERNYFSFWPNLDSLYTTPSVLSLIEGTVPAAQPMPQAIVVFVNGRAHSFYNDFTDEFHGPGSPDPILTERILLKEVIPTVDAMYRTINHRSGRAIEGFSMGGHGALKLAFKFPQLFCSAVAYGGSPYDEIGGGSDNPYSGPIPPENNVMSLAANNRDKILAYQLQIALVVGAQDTGQQRRNEALHVLLDELGIPHTYVPLLPDTRHNWFDYYQQYGEEGLAQHGQCFTEMAGTFMPKDTAVTHAILRQKTQARHKP